MIFFLYRVQEYPHSSEYWRLDWDQARPHSLKDVLEFLSPYNTFCRSDCLTRFKIVFYVDHSGSGSKDELFFLNGQIVLAGPEIALKPEFMMNDILCLGVCCLQFWQILKCFFQHFFGDQLLLFSDILFHLLVLIMIIMKKVLRNSLI